MRRPNASRRGSGGGVTMFAVPEGFEVGRSMCELADDLRAARSTWDGATRDGGQACGTEVVAKAYTAMQEAWFGEIGVHVTLLEQACEAGGASVQ